MAHKSRPSSTEMPFWPEIGPKMGAGQDNRVYRLDRNAVKPHLRTPTGSVLKINHKEPISTVVRHPDEREAAWRGIQYKQNKYELLKLFLGDFVPDSGFVLGKVHEGNDSRYAEYTVQKEVPRISLGDLNEQQKNDPRLLSQVVDLMSRLQYMNDVLGETNARTSSGVNLDGVLNLGGVSDRVRVESLDYRFTPGDARAIIDDNNSPNLLVDPETMRLHCIDFGQGQWTEGMDEAKSLAERIVNDDLAAGIGGLACA